MNNQTVERELTEWERKVFEETCRRVRDDLPCLTPEEVTAIQEDCASEDFFGEHGRLEVTTEDLEDEGEFLLTDSAEETDEEEERFDIDFLVKPSKSEGESSDFDLESEIKDIFSKI